MSGWICLYRDIQNHWIWDFKHADKTMAWIDMLMLANHEKKKFLLNGVLVECDRGELAYSQLTLAERWHWSRNKVRGFMELLKSDGMIVQRSNTVTTVITICNYSQYQDLQPTEGTQEGTALGTTKVQRTASAGPAQGTQTTIKQLNNVNKKDKTIDKSIVSCSEPESGSEPKQPVKETVSISGSAGRATSKTVLEIPTNVSGEYFIVTAKNISDWEVLYPAVDVNQQLRSMLGWSNSNPAKRKTKGGMPRFINNWLAKEQNERPQKNLSTTGQVNNSGSYQKQDQFTAKTARNIAVLQDWIEKGAV